MKKKGAKHYGEYLLAYKKKNKKIYKRGSRPADSQGIFTIFREYYL